MQPDSTVHFVSQLPFEATLQTLREGIAAADLFVLHEIDTQSIVARGGLEIPPLRQILYFHTRFMKRVLESNPRAVIEAPLKFAVREDENGAVNCHYIRPAFLFGRYSGLADLGAELDEIAATIAGSLQK